MATSRSEPAVSAHRWKHHLLALVGVFAISFSGIYVRLAAVSPATASFFRTAYAIPPLLAVWWFRRAFDLRRPRARAVAFAAGVWLGLDLTLYHHAIERIGAGLATILGNTQVVFVAFAAWALHGERPSRTAFAVLPVILAGVALITGLGDPEAYGAQPVSGAAFGLLTGVTYAIFLLSFRVSNRGLAAPGPLLDATVGAALAAAALGWLEPGFSLVPTWPAHGWLAALALGSQFFGWLLIASTLPRLPALETSVLLLMQPALTTLWGFALLGESLSALQWIGGGVVIAGVGLLSSRATAPDRG
jgi:drug/metabolite transporter (DMT)-like permease